MLSAEQILVSGAGFRACRGPHRHFCEHALVKSRIIKKDIALQRNEGPMKASRLVCRSLVVWVAVQSTAWGQPTLQGIGFLPGSGSPTYSDANGISADGLVVVGRASSATGVDAFRWTVETGIVSLGSLPGGSGSIAEEVSGDGSVIVGWGASPESGSNVEAFRWTAETGMVGLGDLPGDYFNSRAYGVSGDGAVVVGRSSADPGPEAFRWTAETGMVPVGESCAESDFLATTARAVSADGLVIVGRGGTCEPGGAQAYRWTAGEGPVGIGVLSGGEWADAYDVSPDGSAIVGRSDSADGSQAFRWTADEGMIGLGDLPGGVFDSWAFGVSADGSIVVGLSCVAGGPLFCSGLDPYIWDAAHGMRNLHDVLEVGYGFDLGGWELTSAVEVTRRQPRCSSSFGTSRSRGTIPMISVEAPKAAWDRIAVRAASSSALASAVDPRLLWLAWNRAVES